MMKHADQVATTPAPAAATTQCRLIHSIISDLQRGATSGVLSPVFPAGDAQESSDRSGGAGSEYPCGRMSPRHAIRAADSGPTPPPGQGHAAAQPAVRNRP